MSVYSAGKISIVAVLIASLVFGVWFYAGWPQIWQEPPFPPKIQEARAEVRFVGSCENSAADGADVTLTLPSMLQNDLVIVAYAVADNDATDFNLAMVTAGYTEVADIYSLDGRETNLGVFYKVMGASPDTSATVDGLGGTDAGVSAVCMAFRGVDTTTPMDVTQATTSGANTFSPNPPSIDHNNPSGVWTVIAGGSAHAAGGSGTYTFPTGYTAGAIDRGQDDTSDSTVGLGYRSSGVSDPEDPGTMTHSGTDAASYSWGAVTMALRPAPDITLGSGTDPSSQTIAPGASITDIDAFTFQTNTGTDSITQATTTFSADISAGVRQVLITSNDGSTVYGTSTLSGTTATTSLSGLTANTTQTQFKIRIEPLSHSAMPGPPGAEYTATATITAWASTNIATGTDSNANALTIDNLSPNGATATSTSAGNQQVTLNWTTSNSSDFSTSTILRWTGATPGSDVPAEGTEYATGSTIGSATVVCKRGDAASTAATGTDGGGGVCTSTALTNGTTYSYKVFQKDSRGNWDVGVSMGSSTPGVAATVSCSTNVATTTFGTLTTASISTASPNASTTMSCSGTSNGCTLYVQDAGNGSNPGLATTSPAYLIPSPNAAFSASTTLVAGTEGYGIQATTTAAGLTIAPRYRLTGNDVGGLSLTQVTIASSSADITGAEVIVTHKAAISNLTQGALYTDTIIYNCLVN